MSKSYVPVLEDGSVHLRPPHARDEEARVDVQLGLKNMWMVELDDRLIGNAFFHSVDKHDKRATLAMGILDANLLGQGLGTRILHMMLGWAFENNGLHRVSLRVLAYNLHAIAAYKKVGFVQEGHERETALVGYEWHDDVLIGLLAAGYQGRAA